MLFIVARTGRGRPTLMHAVGDGSNLTICGLDFSGWSRYYTRQMIPQIMCKRCVRGE